MSDGVDLSIDLESLAAAEDAAIRRGLGAATNTIRRVTRALELDLEAITRSAVPGRLWRAWTSGSSPRAGIAREPAGWVRLNSRRDIDGGLSRTYGAIDYFSSAGRVTGKNSQYLAIPTKAAGSRGRLRNLSPSEWEAIHGIKLRFISSADRGGSGKAGLLVADLGTTSGKGTFRPIRRKKSAAEQAQGFQKGQQTVPIFVLIKAVPFADTFSTAAALSRAEAALSTEFEMLLASVNDQ